MIKLAISAILFITVFVMMRGIATTWRENKMAEPAATVQRANRPVKPPPARPPGITPPAALPNLENGYLFNPERSLTGADNTAADKLNAANDLGIQTNISKVIYTGSIIGDNFKVAILTIPAPKTRFRPTPQNRFSPRNRFRPPQNRSTVKNLRVKEGELLSGYKVTAITPDKIIFEKDGDKVEKLLYDPDKKRNYTFHGRQTPHFVRPAESPLVPVNRTNPIRPRVQTTGRSSGRRLIITRRPPVKPDTSRVARRRRAQSIPSAAPPMPFGR
ncbi:MAG TPA: hypothetical protein ENK33_07420 [Desulfobacterales bacterium]|nr:hypothetical protein [Desulfobacterales bacterium]